MPYWQTTYASRSKEKLQSSIFFSAGVSSPVAFTVSPTSERNYGAGERVVFDDVITNAGGWWNPALQEFTCPTHGLYLFMLNVQSGNNTQNGVNIIVNGAELVRVRADSASSDTYGHGTNTVIYECQQNDRVWVQTHLILFFIQILPILHHSQGFLSLLCEY